ncbi:MAG: T9SS type A sorting domain-containing protein [Bacteroidales bacterium]|nr:T9SS type A sorting domain-containing protein [Bacteroidales bacterium]MDD4217775.1 T9SS type A sorting domain-containing protein [Bacteroidales bacterium]MDY0142692.1 T9SS type A sorting domain-containing protein [Bacteroidales bacterium]
MKRKNKFLYLLVSFYLFSVNVLAQNAICTPNAEVSDPEGVGVRYPNSLPIAFMGEYYNSVLTIIAPKKATTWGFLNFTITKIQLIEMGNIPNGLSWETNSGNTDDYMYAGEKYCMIVKGVPNDIAGIREIDVYANAWIRVIFETTAPGNPRNGGSVTYTLCSQTSVDLGGNRTITTDDEITLDANQGTNFHTYLWSNNTREPDLSICGNELGVGVHEISVMVFDTVGTTGIYSDREPVCYKEDQITITVTQGDNITQESISDFSIYPNPAKNRITVCITDNIKNDNIKLCNTKGDIVKSISLQNTITNIDISDLEKGTYIANFYSDGIKVTSQKLIIY